MNDTQKNAATAGRGLSAMFGLHPAAAAFMVILDLMLTSATISSMGLFVPLELAGGVVAGFITHKIQKAWYGDDATSALIKAMIVGVLTAIPVATTPYIIAYAVGGSLLGLGRKKHTPETIDGVVLKKE
jgi:hypothetical protein